MSPAIPRRKRATGGWIGCPFSAACVRDIADVAKVPIASDPNFEAAAEHINLAFIDFDLALQDESTHGENRRWFTAVAERAAALLDAFGGPGTDERDLALLALIERPTAFRCGGFSEPQFDALLSDIYRLQRTAEIAAAIEKGKETGHRAKGTSADAVEMGFRLAWHTMTKKQYPSITTSLSGPPSGAFIAFTAQCLATASARLANTSLATIAPHLRDLSTRPHTLARWGGPRGKKPPKK